MKKPARRFVLCAVAAGCFLGLTSFAQDTATETGIAGATKALSEGNEAKAWRLYKESEAELNGDLKKVDDAFIVWVADQYRKQKRYAEAIRICDGALDTAGVLDPANAAAMQVVKGDVFRDQENYAAARLEYLGVERNNDYKKTPAWTVARLRIIDVYRVTKDYTAAEDLLERLKDSSSLATQADAYYYSALMAFDRESYGEAREFVEEVRKRVPEHVETLFLEARLNLIEDRLQDPELEIGTRVLTSYVIPGRPITMKMQDRNLAVVRGGAGIPVELRTSKGGDFELVTLLPSPRDPTLFRGSVSSKLGETLTNSTRVEVTGDDVVTYRIQESFQKANDLKYMEKKMLVASDAELSASSGEFLTEEQKDELLLKQRLLSQHNKDQDIAAYERFRDTSVVRPGNDIHVQVIDYDRDMSAEPDTVFVDAVSTSGDRVNGVELTETEPHSGVFVGNVPTAKAPPRATASDTARGTSAGSPIVLGDGGVWRGAAAAGKELWYEVDLMTLQPLAQADLEFDASTQVRAASLVTDIDGETVTIASTRPTKVVQYGYVDLAAHFGGKPEKTAAYVYTEVRSDAARAATFKIGSCDGVVCWLNGERVHSNLGGRTWKPEEDVVNVNLKAGANAILMRVSQLTGPWGVSLTVLDSRGHPLPEFPAAEPAAPGVVTRWHLFDRLTPENIQVAERVNVDRPIRIRDEYFSWVPIDVTPTAALRIDGVTLAVAFHRPMGLRRLRWVFEDHADKPVIIKGVKAVNKFGDTIVPAAAEYATAKENRSLELAPGDQIEVSYRDERHIRKDEVVTAEMRSSFFNAKLSLAYESIGAASGGDRRIAYDEALRYRAGVTDRIVVRVLDYDADLSSAEDRVPVLVVTSAGEKIPLEAIETAAHSGEFLAVLKLGGETAGTAVKVGPDVSVTVSYQDRENSDGETDRSAGVQEASDDPPELILYRSILVTESGLNEKTGKPNPVSLRLMPAGESDAGKPLVTSIDTTLVFKVIYSAAALSVDSTFEAEITTERELGAATAEARAPAWTPVVMSLVDGKQAMFLGEVALRTGDPESYIDIEPLTIGRPADEAERQVAHLYVRGDDVVVVSAKPGPGEGGQTGKYRLASDGRLVFSDRKYEGVVSEMHVGDYAYLRLSDRDMDVSSELDSVDVKIGTKAGQMDLTLVETLPHSGEFTGRILTEPATVAGVSGATTGAVLRANYGDVIAASYLDKACVVAVGPTQVVVRLQIYQGADGEIATFTKRFSDEDIAVRTRLLTAEALFELAKDHRVTEQKELADKELAEGKTILEEAIADYPNTKQAPHAEFLLANLAQELERYEEALERYNRVLSSWPDSEYAARAQLRKGICLEKMEDYDNALDAFVELTYAYPRSDLVSDAIVRLAQYFYRSSQYDVAGRVFGNFAERNPESELAAKTLFLSGQSFMKGAEERRKDLQGIYDPRCMKWMKDAITQFGKLLRQYDDKDLRSEAMYWQADCYMKVNDMRNAYMTLKTLTLDYPESKWAKFARGQLVQNARAFEEFQDM